MKIKYFTDTDTAFLEFTENLVAETVEISEDVYADLDANGDLVCLTIEHAKEKAGFNEISYKEMASVVV